MRFPLPTLLFIRKLALGYFKYYYVLQVLSLALDKFRASHGPFVAILLFGTQILALSLRKLRYAKNHE